MSSRTPAGLSALIDYLKRSRGFDFAGYKPASLERRIHKRMMAVGAREYPDYVDYLEVHPEEFEALFNTILINVTGFFRDAGAWEFLTEHVIPMILERKPDDSSIRVWSAGCASGEEAYTLAMILAEGMGAQGYKDRVKIYATDIDEEALARARQATYDAREIAGVPQQLLATYFERVSNSYAFRKDLRRNVIFGRHDLIQHAPISRVDLLVCRNTLMYFNAETQSRILTRFHFALNDSGVLFLGRAETSLTHANTFAPLDLRRRISTKVPSASLHLRDRLLLIAQNGSAEEGNYGVDLQIRLRESALDAAPIAQLLVDVNGSLVLANERARSLFSISSAELGRPIQDLKISYRPVEIRSYIDQACAERLPSLLRDVEWHAPGGETRWLDVQVVPLIDNSGAVLGASVTFADVSAAKRLQRELEHANQELETAYEELQSTNEELETTNEELQQRSDELNSVNAFLESILTSLRGGVVVVDSELKVLVWNDNADDLWGLRANEAVGRNLLGLDIGLPVERLKQPMKDCLNGNRQFIELQVDATNRKGRSIDCRVTCSPLLGAQRDIRGAIVMMEDLDGQQTSEPRRDGRVKRQERHAVEDHLS
jgi:two-component system CheB/CheR fusion protein